MSQTQEFDISGLSPEMCACLQRAKTEGNTELVQFVRDTVTNGLTVDYYRGRNFYYGPAVVCDYIQAVLSLSAVNCTYDSLGKGFIVYPRRGLKTDISQESGR